MDLQGDLDTFALPDVLRLLAGTAKSGRLEIQGDRGRGAIWLHEGGVVAGEIESAPHADEPTDVVFELLRFRDGSFRFDADADASVESDHTPIDIDPLLAQAEEMLAEWREIEAVVPTLDAWLGLAPEVTTDEIIVSRDDWRMLACVGGGTSARELGDRLDMTELAVGRIVRDLVVSGTIVVGEELPSLDRLDALSASSSSLERGEEPAMALLPEPLPGTGTSFDSNETVAVEASSRGAQAPVASPAYRQLHNLSTAAVEALTAAAEEAGLGLDLDPGSAGSDEDPSVDRSSLLRFLSSVKS